MSFFGGVISISNISTLLFVVFSVLFLGYVLGRITIKGISLGDAGVFIVALVVGALLFGVNESEMLVFDWSSKPYDFSSGLSIIESLGLVFSQVMLICGLYQHFLGTVGKYIAPFLAVNIFTHIGFAVYTMHSQRGGVVRIVMGFTEHAPMLLVDVLALTAMNASNEIPTLIIPRSLKLTNHAVNHCIGNLALPISLSALTLRQRASDKQTRSLAINLCFDGGDCSLARFGHQIGGIIDHVISILEGFDTAVKHGLEYCLRVALVIGVTPQFLTNIVGRYPNRIRLGF